MENPQSTDDRAERIATLNDDFRRHIGKQSSGRSAVPGTALITCGINALPVHTQLLIMLLVHEYQQFTPDNDPQGEHDFGSFIGPGAGRIFWKIDYYADAELREGSEDPSDPAKSFRVLTIMLATEY